MSCSCETKTAAVLPHELDISAQQLRRLAPAAPAAHEINDMMNGTSETPRILETGYVPHADATSAIGIPGQPGQGFLIVGQLPPLQLALKRLAQAFGAEP